MTEAISEKGKAPALDKGLDILEFMAEQDQPQSIYDISRGLNRTRGEIYRMLNCLVKRGYLDQSDDTDKLELTNKIFGLASRLQRTETLIETARPILARLRDETGLSMMLTVRSGRYGVVVFSMPAQGRLAIYSPVGHRTLLWQTAPGHAILAGLPQSQIAVLQDEVRDLKDVPKLTNITNDAPVTTLASADPISGIELAVKFSDDLGGATSAISCFLPDTSTIDVAAVSERLAAVREV